MGAMLRSEGWPESTWITNRNTPGAKVSTENELLSFAVEGLGHGIVHASGHPSLMN